MNFIFRIFIPGTPVTKKNSQQMAFNPKTQRWFPVPSKAYKQFEKNAKEVLKQYDGKPIDFKVNIQCMYFFHPNKDGTEPKKQPDLANLLEATDDILVKYKIIADDNVSIVAGHDGSRVVYSADTEPGTYIVVRKI